MRLAFVFRPGFVGRHGDIVKRLATYADLLGMSYSEGWRQDAAWIAEQALNKPVILKLDDEASAAASQFLAAMLAASGTSVEIVWAEPPDAKAAAALCASSTFMSHHISEQHVRCGFRELSVQCCGGRHGNNDEHWWFSGGALGCGDCGAREREVRNSPKTVRLQSVKSRTIRDQVVRSRDRRPTPSRRSDRRLTKVSRKPAPAPANTR